MVVIEVRAGGKDGSQNGGNEAWDGVKTEDSASVMDLELAVGEEWL